MVRLTMNSFPGVYAVPGATQVLVVQGLQYVEMPLDMVRTTPLVPMIGPALGLLIDGNPPSRTAPVSETPTLTWQPPAVGSASAYVVSIHELALQGAGDTRGYDRVVAQFFTTETTVQVVPKVLVASKAYFYGVTAVTGSVDIKSAPYLAQGTIGASTVLSGQFTR